MLAGDRPIVETECPSGAPAAAWALAAAPASVLAPPVGAPGVGHRHRGMGRGVPRRLRPVGRDRVEMEHRDAYGRVTLEGNHELEWYTPGNSVLTTDTDAGQTVSVLQQRLTAQPVPGTYYPVGVLSRVYPPVRCPQYYDARAPRLRRRQPRAVPVPLRHAEQREELRVQVRLRRGAGADAQGFALWPALWLRDWKAWSYELDALEGFDRDAGTFRGTYWWGNGSNVSTSADGDLGVNADQGVEEDRPRKIRGGEARAAHVVRGVRVERTDRASRRSGRRARVEANRGPQKDRRGQSHEEDRARLHRLHYATSASPSRIIAATP